MRWAGWAHWVAEWRISPAPHPTNERDKTVKTYHLSIELAGEPATEYIASAYGNLDVVNYVARQAGKTMEQAVDTQFTVSLVETDGIAGDERRSLIDFTGDADVAWMVLSRKLRTERKAATETAAE